MIFHNAIHSACVGNINTFSFHRLLKNKYCVVELKFDLDYMSFYWVIQRAYIGTMNMFSLILDNKKPSKLLGSLYT